MNWHLTLKGAEEALRNEQQHRFVTLMRYGSMSVEYYAPVHIDPQQPHAQDELYIIISGSGTFVRNGEKKAIKTGDILFVPAGTEHRFEEFSTDFATWVVFYGPTGGEQ